MIPFLKMHGLGNDFVVLDNRAGELPALDWRGIADRHFGIGCDQVVVMETSSKADVFMRIYNADGGEVESCGNASRCIARLIAEEKQRAQDLQSVTLETLAGVVEARVSGTDVTIDMGAPKLGWREIPLSGESDTLHLAVEEGPLADPVAVSMGNPHMVFFVSDVGAVPLETVGPALETHPLFPARANVGVAHVEAPDRIHLRVWERGAGLTLACGTGACAALVAASLRGLAARKADVHLPGGALSIEWRTGDHHVLMTGPASVSFSGQFDERALKR